MSGESAPCAEPHGGGAEARVARWQAEIPLYRERGGGFITKADIRRGFPRNFLGPNLEVGALIEDRLIELEHTAGTSEDRTPLLLPYGWWAEQELAALRLNSQVAQWIGPETRRVGITSPVCSGDIRFSSVPCHSDRVVGQTLFLNWSRYPFLWTDDDLERMAAEALDWKPVFLDVDPVYGGVFARHCERRGIRIPSLRFILCSYEFVSVLQRQALERAFGVPVLNLYGSTETGHLLMEVEEGLMRASHQTARLEIIAPDAAGVGELIVTTLTNPWMPLLNYRIGDLVQAVPAGGETRYRVHGRTLDAFMISGGRRVTTWEADQCFRGLNGLVHYQIIQQAGERWKLRYLPARPAPSGETLAELRARLAGLLGGDWQFEAVELLAPEKSGKFRLGYPGSK
jgi:phenylacetate-CoA ligase